MRAALPLLIVVGLLAGCGSGSNKASETTTTGGTTTAAPKPLKTVRVSEIDFKLNPNRIALPRPGVYRFIVSNNGRSPHALVIEAQGFEAKTQTLDAGEGQTLTVDLKAAGRYEMYCPVDSHRQNGMEGTLSVAPVAGGG